MATRRAAPLNTELLRERVQSGHSTRDRSITTTAALQGKKSQLGK